MKIESFLSSLQWGDSAFPTGRYTLSQSLESFIQNSLISGQTQCSEFLRQCIVEMVAPNDGVAIAYIMQLLYNHSLPHNIPYTEENFVSTLIFLDYQLLVAKPTQEMRSGSQRVGRQMLDVFAAIDNQTENIIYLYKQELDAKNTPGNQAVAAALIHHEHGLNIEEAVSAELLSFCLSFSSAALRLRQCDHIGAQRMVTQNLLTISSVLEDVLKRAQYVQEHGLDILPVTNQHFDIVSSWHERAPARLFLN